mgnify:FL=1
MALSFAEGQQNRVLTYRQLAAEAAFWQAYWHRQGFRPGARIVMAITPGPHAYAITLSLLASGLVPVFIDVEMPRHHVRYVLEGSQPVAVIATRRALRWHWLVPELKECQRFSINGPFPGLTSMPVRLAQLARDENDQPLSVSPCSADQHGIISFTSENRGIPMGADRTHGSLHHHYLAMSRFWPGQAQDVEMSSFPLTVLHNLSAGVPTVLPAIDFAHPGQLTRRQARRALQQLADNRVTRLSGAPAFFAALCDCMEEDNIRIPQLDELMISRATVSASLAARLLIRFPQAQAWLIYGATEAEPICAVTLNDYLRAENKPGYRVGPPVENTELMVCRALDDKHLNPVQVQQNRCPTGEIGEILVAGPHVLARYINNPQAVMQHKIPRAVTPGDSAAVWHRTGDTGYFDEQGELWLTGRIKDLVYAAGQVVHPYVIEKQIDTVAGIRRCALIGSAGGDHGVRLYLVCDEPLEDLLAPLTPVLMTLGVSEVDIYRLTVMPTDRRHNSKVDRPLLRTRSRRIHATEYQRWSQP